MKKSEMTNLFKSCAVLPLLFASLLVTVCTISFTGIAFGGCLSLVKGPIVADIIACHALEPEKTLSPQKASFQWIGDLDAKSRSDLYETYRGLFLKARVVKSQAVNQGLSEERGALIGKEVFVFFKEAGATCATFHGKRSAGQLEEVCCDGHGNSPCLLDTGYVFKSLKPVGAVGTSAGDVTRKKASTSKDYQEAEKAFNEKKYRAAIKSYELARMDGSLDIKGHYRLGLSYREVDESKKAIPILEQVHTRYEGGESWADEEQTVRDAIFLLARCYAKTNQPEKSVLILEGYLLDPKKHKKEIQESLKERDFGWINTSKPFKDYKAQALKVLGQK